MNGVLASEQKKIAELFEISADFSAFLTKFQHFSAHISELLFKVFALNFLKIERISAHFLHNIWKFYRPGLSNKARLLVYFTSIIHKTNFNTSKKGPYSVGYSIKNCISINQLSQNQTKYLVLYFAILLPQNLSNFEL